MVVCIEAEGRGEEGKVSKVTAHVKDRAVWGVAEEGFVFLCGVSVASSAARAARIRSSKWAEKRIWCSVSVVASSI